MKFELAITDIIPRTIDATSFRFPRPPELKYSPGQFMLVTIKSGEKEIVHPFSFSSSPTEQDHIEFTKKFTSNEYSTALKALKIGDQAMIDAPYGKFTFEGEFQKIALLTGGIGITPFRSIVKYCTDSKLSSNLVLFYGCRSPRDIAFKEELEQMQEQNSNLRLHFMVNEPTSDWKGGVGNITAEMVEKVMPDYNERIFYACGPPGMVAAMTNLIKQLGIPDERLKMESFAGYT